MLRGSLLLLSLVAACTFAPPDDHGATGGVDGQVVDPNDRDGDTIPNDNDNCPDDMNPDQKDGDGDGVGDACDNCVAVANPRKVTMGFDQPIQRDHDGDKRGDECDLCPHLASPTSNDDGDGDGIGDACDPEPTMANPAPYWNGFYEAPDDMWSARTGMKTDWELALRDGTLGWRQKTLSGRHQLLYAPRHQEAFVQSSLIVDEIADSATAVRRSATVAYGFEDLGLDDGYYSCGMVWNTSPKTSDVIVGLQHDDDFLTADTRTASWTGELLGKPIDVTGRGDRTGNQQPNMGGSALRCDSTDGVVTQSATHSLNARPDGQIGLQTSGMTALFDYIFIVEPRPRP